MDIGLSRGASIAQPPSVQYNVMLNEQEWYWKDTST